MSLTLSITDANIRILVNAYLQGGDFMPPISTWDVSQVTDMSNLFAGQKMFNSDLFLWNVSNVTNMDYMFAGCVFFDQKLDAWDVSNVRSMCGMFAKCEYFNQTLWSWNVSNVRNMDLMFLDCSRFNQPLDLWNLSSVESMQGMFKGCSSLHQSFAPWVIPHDVATRQMFANASRMPFYFYPLLSHRQLREQSLESIDWLFSVIPWVPVPVHVPVSETSNLDENDVYVKLGTWLDEPLRWAVEKDRDEDPDEYFQHYRIDDVVHSIACFMQSQPQFVANTCMEYIRRRLDDTYSKVRFMQLMIVSLQKITASGYDGFAPGIIALT